MGIVTFGDSSDARSATPEDLSVERLRLCYFGLTSFLAALILLSIATSLCAALSKLRRAAGGTGGMTDGMPGRVAGGTAAAGHHGGHLEDDENDNEEEGGREGTSGGVAQGSTPPRSALLKSGLASLACMAVGCSLAYCLMQMLVLPLLAEEAVMPIEEMRQAYCETAALPRCGGWL